MMNPLHHKKWKPAQTFSIEYTCSILSMYLRKATTHDDGKALNILYQSQKGFWASTRKMFSSHEIVFDKNVLVS